ncbi:hypothetical protein QR680_009535 [Steinernema hermaphroditum]|uniref:Lethal giant larvae homologue 2 domain-containing protein n=1 Tax=Steinernema hermaphroditum TaxID=289476 RepID=A0AA39IMG1_9BILA|nr:hypothetical protein QR680_009535 [Steinernema hermaphroditum]
MDRAKKKLASALDGLRSLHVKTELDLNERIAPEHVCLSKIVRQGFPDDPRCIAFDPIQRLFAIGSSRGSVRLLGRDEYHLSHDCTSLPVIHVEFLVNEGGLITVCPEDTIHLWNYRQKVPEIVHSLQMNKEKVTCIHLPFQSKWLYVGTDKGNTYVVCVATFQLSMYTINWNKAIDLSCRTHPGFVREICVCPDDPSHLLILFEKGILVLWNLSTREAERINPDAPVRSFSWHFDGKQFICGHIDGSLTVWNTRKLSECQSKTVPHGQGNQRCRAITRTDWTHAQDNDQASWTIFTGGMPSDEGILPVLTILKGSKSITALEMDHQLVSFVTLCAQPFSNAPQQPYAVAVLLKSDFLVIDLHSPGYPCFECPYPMDVHESPVTCVEYYSECPVDLIAALVMEGRKQRRQIQFSDKQWPVMGGIGRECATSHEELLLTGHEDGSIKFWHASGEHLSVLYKLKTGRHFERTEGVDLKANCHAVSRLEICLESRMLLVAGSSGQITLFRFQRAENSNEIAVVTIPSLTIASLSAEDEEQSTSRDGSSRDAERHHRLKSQDSRSSETSEGSQSGFILPLKVRGGSVRRPAGYQPELVCLIPWISTSSSETIHSMAFCSAYGILAIGTGSGLALVDIAMYSLIYSWTTVELSGRDAVPFCIQAPNSDTSPCVEQPQCPSDGASPQRTRQLGRQLSTSGVVSLLRRNTADLAASARKKLQKKMSNPEAIQRRQKGLRRFDDDGGIWMGPEQESMETGEKDHDSPESGSTPGLHSSMSECRSSPSNSSNKSFMRLNTEFRQKSGDRRPVLSKAQSVIDSSVGGNGSFRCTNGDPTSSIANGSRSPSVCSQERFVFNESVTSLKFINSYTKRNSPKCGPSLWIGTSLGSCISFDLLLPHDRMSTNAAINASAFFDGPRGSVIRMKGESISVVFLDSSFCLVSPATDSWKDPNKEQPISSNSEKFVNRIVTKASLSPALSNASENHGAPDDINQVVVLCAEEEIRVVALPSFNQLFHYKAEIPLVKVKETHIRGYPALLLLSASGAVQVLSLPSLRPLFSAPLFKQSLEIGDPMCHKTSFSDHGLGVYMATPSEIQKFTVCSELTSQVAESMGELFVPVDTPEPPKTSFFKGVSTLFSSQKESIDLDSVFSEKSNSTTVSGMRSIARTIQGPSLEQATGRAVTAGQAASMAVQALNERGEKLNATLDATEHLKNNAMNLQQRSGKLLEKYEKKKWYQL